MPRRALSRRARRRAVIGLGVALLAVVAAGFTGAATVPPGAWSATELAAIRALWIGSLPPLPPDPSNRYADDSAAAEFGKALFFDRRLSGSGMLACGDCHEPGRAFQDGTPLGHGAGTTARRTMPVAGTAYSPWFFWDGRADSQWAQALAPLESDVEHAGTRSLYARVIALNYRRQYQTVFGALPDLRDIPYDAGPVGIEERRAAWSALSGFAQDSITRVFVNAGKAIAAFERRIQYRESRFDRYAAHVLGLSPDTAARFTADEAEGLRLFVGAAGCAGCHSGPLFTDNRFHNIGVAGTIDGRPDSGRAAGIHQLRASEFNCLGAFSDARPEQCALSHLDDSAAATRIQAFRTPSLRAVAKRPPYGHTGEFATLAAVIDFHNRAPDGTAGRTELRPLGLSTRQIAQIEAFLRTLDSRAVMEPITSAATPDRSVDQKR